ncbi:MAG: tRNA pseudouridine38-40 synthase [Chlamydiales bacterium]|jgi:tRNA pseudouridine38-40 synthase
MKFKLTIAYDGTAYSGWQVQPNALTIQELLENALKILLRQEVRVIGAGRTDAGVHARAQVAHFIADQNLDVSLILASVNGILPNDVTVLDLEEVSDEFHARFGAKRKIYHYHLSLNRFQDPFRRRYSHHVRHRLDVDLLREAAREFVGTHNFRSFANEAYAGSAAKNPIRTLSRLDVVEEPDGFIRLEFEGESFLYKMVRNITGTLLEVASGKRPVTEIREIMEAKDRRRAGRAAPALGLFMVSIHYAT